MAFLEIDNLKYSYPETSHHALNNISLKINEGDMVLLVGSSGSGKSSLLRALCRLIPDFYGGSISGTVQVAGRPLATLSRKELLQTIGMVYENPENQLVMTTVEQELAFGLENLGLPVKNGLLRLGEMAEALSLASGIGQTIASLSGGQKQKTALAAVLALRPQILLLDEPTSRLDPVASEELFSFLRRLNEENGLTIIMAEHRLERCYHLVDRVVYLDEGRIIREDKPADAARWAAKQGSPFIPPVPRLFAQMGCDQIPLTVKQGKDYLDHPPLLPYNLERTELTTVAEIVLAVTQLSFAYPGGPPVLKNVDLSLPRGSITALMGANGAGKSTLGKSIMGLLKPSQGGIYLQNQAVKGTKTEVLARKIGYLPQELSQYFFLPTVDQEIEFNRKNLGCADDEWYQYLVGLFSLSALGGKNPRDLSRGEQQKAALACVLLPKPAVLLLDEPTQGLDLQFKQELGRTMTVLQQEGISTLMITHDVEFVADYADRVAFLQQGEVIGMGTKREMLSGNTFYSPQINRLLGGKILTVGEALIKLEPWVTASEIMMDTVEK
ncbi:MAG: ABC transporter ATP-binding protein [Methanomassiliicoccales archaeon]